MKRRPRKAYVIGGGIASLAAAVYLIHDGGFDGDDISIIEASPILGGSLDSTGSGEMGYIARGGRMFADKVYSCTYDLFSLIPLEDGSSKTLLDDFNEFNASIKINAKARLVDHGNVLDASQFSMSYRDMMRLFKLVALPESRLGNSTISDHFSSAFFETNFWLEFCTTFAFCPWHSAVEFRRYILRFLQELPRMHTMEGVRYTRYNQYDSVVVPIATWLKKQGVHFVMDTCVASLHFVKRQGVEQVDNIICQQEGASTDIAVGRDDLVFFTNGSMTSNSTFGSMKSAPKRNDEPLQDSWAVWKAIAKGRPHFGRPDVFCGRIEKTAWESFSVTCRGKAYADLMTSFSNKIFGTEGMITLKGSPWLLSIVTPPQPHFVNQPDSITVFWGYGQFPDKKGEYVKKMMSECTGEEILIEVFSHLGLNKDLPRALASMNCIPCMMPYISSQFMPRRREDRPEVLPKGTRNFAFMGQYCEVPAEVVFTVEQSVRSAMIAVRGLTGSKKKVPPIYRSFPTLF